MKNEQEIVRSVFDAYIRDAKASSTKKDRPTFDMLEEVKNRAIKALEQQPSEDCVSRKSLLDKLDPLYKEKIKTAPDNMAEGFLQVSNLIKYEPPVTPIHGTCKDCRNARESHYNKCIYCTRIERNCVEDFYCKAYRKTR